MIPEGNKSSLDSSPFGAAGHRFTFALFGLGAGRLRRRLALVVFRFFWVSVAFVSVSGVLGWWRVFGTGPFWGFLGFYFMAFVNRCRTLASTVQGCHDCHPMNDNSN